MPRLKKRSGESLQSSLYKKGSRELRLRIGLRSERVSRESRPAAWGRRGRSRGMDSWVGEKERKGSTLAPPTLPLLQKIRFVKTRLSPGKGDFDTN